MTEHKHRKIIEEWLKDTSRRVRSRVDGPDCDWGPWFHMRTNASIWSDILDYELEPIDPHAEMRAKFEAEPDRYLWSTCKWGTECWSDWYANTVQPAWKTDYEYCLEEIPHWELQKKLREEPGKWDVEILVPVDEIQSKAGWYYISSPNWIAGEKYRLVPKRKMLTIIGVDGKAYEFPEPMREAPEEGTEFWYIAATEKKVFVDYWTGEQFDIDALKFNNVHRTREDAIACRNAWILARGGKLPEGE